MFPYAIKRILGIFPTLLILIALTFFLVRLAPGGPFDTEQIWPPEIQANILKKYHLDQPLYIQFAGWIKDLFHGDLNESFQYLGQPVTQILKDTLPISSALGSSALFLCISFGIPLGCLAGWKHNSWIDRGILLFAISGTCLPVFLIASLLILCFSIWLNWLPPALWEDSRSMILPILTLSWRPTAMIIQLTRTSMLNALQSDYIRTARSKGMPESVVIFQHALKNTLIPTLATLGPITANLIAGSFVVELMFQIPGMGRHFVQAVLNRDYPLVMGVTLTYGTLLILSNLIIDLLSPWIDPRIQMEES